MPLPPGLGHGDILSHLERNQLDSLVYGGEGLQGGGGGGFFVFGWG